MRYQWHHFGLLETFIYGGRERKQFLKNTYQNANGEDFPDATAMLGCGTNVELPVTRINYYYEEKPTSVDEIEAVNAQDGPYYNMMGQKFTQGNMPAGIYIHNGKKVIVK